MKCLYTHIPSPMLNLLALLAKCPCELCKNEIKRLEEKYSVNKKHEVNKGQAGNVQAERLNPEDDKEIKGLQQSSDAFLNFVPIPNFNFIVCDSPTPENKENQGVTQKCGDRLSVQCNGKNIRYGHV